jgi:hypothetical protein
MYNVVGCRVSALDDSSFDSVFYDPGSGDSALHCSRRGRGGGSVLGDHGSHISVAALGDPGSHIVRGVLVSFH